MSQWDIIEVLREERKYLSAREIARQTQKSLASTHRNLKKIRRTPFYNRNLEVKKFNVAVGKTTYKRAIKKYRIR
jgi:DNA-binding IclR family transcriptional regulator